MATIFQAEKLLMNVKDVDIIVMGEMALLKYKYKSVEEVEPWSEMVPKIDEIQDIQDQTSTFRWVYRTSVRFNCWV